MANTQATFGFKHIGFLSGGSPDFQQVPRAIQSTNATKIGFGDPVMKVNITSNYITQATVAASTTQAIEGIFVGCNFPDSTLGQNRSPFWPGAAAGDAVGYIVDAPNALFLVAATNTAIVTANIGQAIGFAIGTASTVGGGFSVATVDQATATSTGTTASTLPFKIVSLYQGIGNGSDPTTAFNWVIVTFNSQKYKTLAGF